MMTSHGSGREQLSTLIAHIPPLDERAADACRQRQDQLTKPPGSLGRLERLVALDLRLGEGSGAALVLPILDAATALLDEMATFEEAGVSSAAALTSSGSGPPRPSAETVARRARHMEPGRGWSMVKMLPSVSLHLTNVPMVGISILSPRSWPPADLTFAIASSMLSTPTTHE